MKKNKLLIIKTGYSEILHDETISRKASLGDVLRTTPILHLFKDHHVTWITDEKAIPLLEGNPFIDRLMIFDWINIRQLEVEHFDILINLEKSPGICALADKIKAWKRYGFRSELRNGRIEVEAYDKAFDILTMSKDLESKKKNLKSVQELLFEIVESNWDGEEYVLGYKPQTKEEYDIGLNSQIGEKWSTKSWPKHYWDELENLLIKNSFKITRQEKAEINKIKVTEDLYTYMDWINSCKLILSNDSLGLHLAMALKKKVLGFFGPTSAQEVHFYNRGKAIFPTKVFPCFPCFLKECRNEKFCLQHITPEFVFNEIKELLRFNPYTTQSSQPIQNSHDHHNHLKYPL